MLTLGEMRAGGARGVLDVLCVRLDRSVSAGVASNGRLHRGAQGRAGLIGHAPTGEGGGRLICHCGARGCLDVVASGEALARQALAEARAGHSRYLAEVIERQGQAKVTANEVIQGAQLGDAPFCAEMLARSGRLVGEAVAPLRQPPQPGNRRAGGRPRPFGRNSAGGRPRRHLPALASARDVRPSDCPLRACRLGGTHQGCGLRAGRSVRSAMRARMDRIRHASNAAFLYAIFCARER